MGKRKLPSSENDVKKLVKSWFDERAAWSFAPVQRGIGEHGIPDRIACVPVVVTQEMVGRTVGLFVAVEAKAPGRRGERNAGLAATQLEQCAAIQKASGIIATVDSAQDVAEINLDWSAYRSQWWSRAAHRFWQRVANHG